MKKIDVISALIDIIAVILVTATWAGMYFTDDLTSITRSVGTISACAFLTCLRLVYILKQKSNNK